MDTTTESQNVTTTTEKLPWIESFEFLNLPAPLFIVVAACIVIALLMLITLCLCCWCKCKERGGTRHLDSTKYNTKTNSYLNMAVPADSPGAKVTSRAKPTGQLQSDVMDKLESAMKRQIDSFCLESRRLTLGEAIGSGRFGVVYKATLTDKDLKNPQEVAAKTVQGEDCHEKEMSDFIEEVLRMRGFHHRNVLAMLGLVLQENKPFAVLPFMRHGDLRSYLKNKDRKMVVRDLVEFCHQVAEGMTYLSEQGFVHRDLATRNCMVDEDSVIKIADFGLSRDIFRDDYYRMGNLDQPLPVRWMAVESIKEKIFTIKTDVWSFGIVMWEVMTRGQTPYSDKENQEVVNHIKTGGRPSNPPFCPDEVFSVMKKCWKNLPEDRPNFRQLSDELRGMLGTPRNKVQKKIDKYYNMTEVEAFQTNKKTDKLPKKGKGSKSK